jgi:hypothetical protein
MESISLIFIPDNQVCLISSLLSIVVCTTNDSAQYARRTNIPHKSVEMTMNHIRCWSFIFSAILFNSMLATPDVAFFNISENSLNISSHLIFSEAFSAIKLVNFSFALLILPVTSKYVLSY